MGRNMSAEEKIAKAESDAQKAEYNIVMGKVMRCRDILSEHADLGGQCLEFPQKAVAKKKAGGFVQGSSSEACQKRPADDSAQLHEMWLEQYTKLEMTPSKILQRILNSFDPKLSSQLETFEASAPSASESQARAPCQRQSSSQPTTQSAISFR